MSGVYAKKCQYCGVRMQADEETDYCSFTCEYQDKKESQTDYHLKEERQ